MFLSLDIRCRIQLIQDFEMPTVSNSISISNDGRYIFATGMSTALFFCVTSGARISDASLWCQTLQLLYFRSAF